MYSFKNVFIEKQAKHAFASLNISHFGNTLLNKEMHNLRKFSAGILEHSMGARSRVGIGLS